jgi:hypothetical protein
VSKNDLLKNIVAPLNTNYLVNISWILFFLNSAIFVLMMTSNPLRESYKIDAAFFSELVQPLTVLIVILLFYRKIKIWSLYNIALLFSFIFLLGEEEGWGTSRFNYQHPEWILPHTTSSTFELHTFMFYGIEVEYIILALLLPLWTPFFFLRPFGLCTNLVRSVLSKKTSVLLLVAPTMYLMDFFFLHLPDKGHLDVGDFWGIELELIFYQVLLIGITKSEIIETRN